ncbi:hypothetical protein [[Limnothrix rosea] IAM M-220]|uniref:hypothetical protein n=1 Tax=[Limnothrix rosea] IAM M-220 TaxID=454133 RepID=UPI0009685B99|nr:hypothetical protein [[Limnothrix rosea] IAM M-220]OKH14664.1 hypothetical protein NIES208_13485 [[Limnothrix rosea] IAM M-220]
MTADSPFTAAERIASLKAAVIGGISAGFISFMILILRRVFVFGFEGLSLTLTSSMATLTLCVNTVIVGFSGALFALVYRYAIRQDKNPQLNAGVVFAFTLVRGLALVDAGSAIAQNFVPFFLACGESLIIFGLTALLLSFLLQRQWLTYFGQSINP